MRPIAPVLALCLAACAANTTQVTVGRDFPRAPFATFTLDSTSVADAEAALGQPMRQTSVRRLAGATSKSLVPGTPITLTVLSYYFFPNGTGPLSQGHPGKAASLAFLNGRLIGFGDDSTLPGDANPPIDETRLDSLHQCQSTRREVIALLGEPNAKALHVLDAQAGAVDFVYSWQNLQAGLTTRRSLRIFFDRSGAMSNYTLVDDQSAPNGLSAVAHPSGPPTLPPACPNILGRQHT